METVYNQDTKSEHRLMPSVTADFVSVFLTANFIRAGDG